jgi:hypothetical protein
MWTLDVEEMESSSKINLKDVSWWMSIKDAYRPRALIIVKLSKERCIYLAARGRPFHLHIGMIETCVNLHQYEKRIPPKHVYRKYET